MVSCPDSLVWELTKRNSSFIKKRNGKTKRTGKVEFSTEKGNLASLNRFKYSGLANSKVFNVVCTDDNKATLIIKNAGKSATQPNKSTADIPLNKSDYHKVAKTIKNTTDANYYRKDLSSDALAKWYKIYTGNKRANGVKKGVPPKMGRGTN